MTMWGGGRGRSQHRDCCYGVLSAPTSWVPVLMSARVAKTIHQKWAQAAPACSRRLVPDDTSIGLPRLSRRQSVSARGAAAQRVQRGVRLSSSSDSREVELVSRRCGKFRQGRHPISRTAQRCRASRLRPNKIVEFETSKAVHRMALYPGGLQPSKRRPSLQWDRLTVASGLEAAKSAPIPCLLRRIIALLH